MAGLLEQGYASGARVHNNSWYSGVNFYTGHTRQVDAIARLHEDYVIVFAAGNLASGMFSTFMPPTCTYWGAFHLVAS